MLRSNQQAIAWKEGRVAARGIGLVKLNLPQVGAEPRVFLWSSTTLRGPEGADDPIELNLPYGHRGVIVMGFSHDGNKLATVSTDDEHTVCPGTLPKSRDRSLREFCSKVRIRIDPSCCSG
eukprot:SAG11_NODE_1367_length_5098_cov_4.225445_4_plen_121_part_00